jgi:hypothetical protein
MKHEVLLVSTKNAAIGPCAELVQFISHPHKLFPPISTVAEVALFNCVFKQDYCILSLLLTGLVTDSSAKVLTCVAADKIERYSGSYQLPD